MSLHAAPDSDASSLSKPILIFRPRGYFGVFNCKIAVAKYSACSCLLPKLRVIFVGMTECSCCGQDEHCVEPSLKYPQIFLPRQRRGGMRRDGEMRDRGAVARRKII